MENDLTANLKGTMMTDHNGETAALIKVVTSEQGFTFDGGMVGIVKTKQEAGEVWVWVPHGIKKMSVRHPQLGVLRDYYFPISIEKARTYEMVLTTGKVQTLVNHSIKKQFVIFNVTPANATIEFNGENLSVDETGYAETSVPFGRYNYRVMHPDYHTSAGVADVLEGGSKVVINANLTPNFGYLDIVASEEYNGASVYVNGVQHGELPLQKIQLRSAAYVVRIEKDLYKPYEQSVEVKDGETNHWVLPAMEANFAMIELLSQPKTEIWLNGELKGVEKWTGPLSVGEYRVETKQISHVPATETIRIMDTTARSIQLKLPTPLYSSMEITSSPSRAKVYIDGVDMGETPLILNEVLIGMREVVLEKEGLGRQVRNVQVDYGVSSSLKVDMTAPQAEVQSAVTSAQLKENSEGVSMSATGKDYVYVDLGLSVKWAMCNVGAITPEDYGDYFAWGETEPKNEYSKKVYKFRVNSGEAKYNTNIRRGVVDNNATLELEDDAARVNWGGNWRMPTKLEQNELKKYCKWKWTRVNGVEGYKVTSKINGNSIFLPMAGYRAGASVRGVGSQGFYWSSSLNENNPSCAYSLVLSSGTGNVYRDSSGRNLGYSVRAVCP